jgi:hypothetical protein
MERLFNILILIFLFSIPIYSQGTAGELAKYEYRYLIDMPTAGILEKGVVGVTTEILPEGVLIEVIEAGILK